MRDIFDIIKLKNLWLRMAIFDYITYKYYREIGEKTLATMEYINFTHSKRMYLKAREDYKNAR